MRNADINERLLTHHIYRWQLAEAMGVSEYTICRWMRHELSPERRTAALEAIERIIQGRGEALEK